MSNVRYGLKSAFQFKPAELKVFLLSTIISGFILSFRKWGTVEFNLTEGVSNFLLYAILFMILFAIFIMGQKFVAGWLGYECTFKLWEFGPFIGLLITFISYGFIPFLYLGSVELKTIEHLRLGKFRQSLNMKDLMYAGIVGPLVLVFLNLLVLVPIYFITGFEIFKAAIMVSVLIIFFSSLPLPNTNGLNVLFAPLGRIIWLVYFIFGLVLVILILLFNIYTYIVAFILALIIAWIIRKLIKANI